MARDGRPRGHAACGIGFLASRKGVAERRLVDTALGLCQKFDHRGAPGHGAGILMDIPWALLLDRFPGHARPIANRDVALGTFFLPAAPGLRDHCMERVEALAALAGADLLGWAEVPLDLEALPASSAGRRDSRRTAGSRAATFSGSRWTKGSPTRWRTSSRW
jgi:glutamate synthase domain-containing protein 1